ncbi:unnamed protein product [Trichobilharzia szidati]|nr:unnamed protein product [Trichobilharzia szidati]
MTQMRLSSEILLFFLAYLASFMICNSALPPSNETTFETVKQIPIQPSVEHIFKQVDQVEKEQLSLLNENSTAVKNEPETMIIAPVRFNRLRRYFRHRKRMMRAQYRMMRLQRRLYRRHYRYGYGYGVPFKK